MTKVIIEINGCKECPHFKTTNQYSTDGFDHMEDWICTKLDMKIRGSVEWIEEGKIEVPKWCPITVKNVKDQGIYINELAKKIIEENKINEVIEYRIREKKYSNGTSEYFPEYNDFIPDKWVSLVEMNKQVNNVGYYKRDIAQEKIDQHKLYIKERKSKEAPVILVEEVIHKIE